MDGAEENGERAADREAGCGVDSGADDASGRAGGPEVDAGPDAAPKEHALGSDGEGDRGATHRRPPPGIGDPHHLEGRILCDRYRVDEPIGQGGMAVVFKGYDLHEQREVAIKVLRPGMRERPDAVTRFLREAKITVRVRHEHVIRVTDYGQDDQGVVFSIMEYLDGEDLGATLEREGALPWPRVRWLVLQVCEALQAVHDAGVVHRDLKPRNCFVCRGENAAEHVKILDFGIAKLAYSAEDVEQDLTAEGAIFGTPEYIAPEQAKNAEDVDERADIYAVGVLLYQLCCGRPPFRAKSPMVTLAMHIYEDCEPPRRLVPELPAQLEDVILRALRKNPDERYQSAEHLGAALKAIDAESGDAQAFAEIELDTRRMPRTEGRVFGGIRPGLIALGSAALVMVGAVAFTLADPTILEKREALTTTTESVMPRTLAGMRASAPDRRAFQVDMVSARSDAAEDPDPPPPTVLPMVVPPVVVHPHDATEHGATEAKSEPRTQERRNASRRTAGKRAERRKPTKAERHRESSETLHAALPEPPDDAETPAVPLQSVVEDADARERPLADPAPQGRSFRLVPPATPDPFSPLRNHTWRRQ